MYRPGGASDADRAVGKVRAVRHLPRGLRALNPRDLRRPSIVVEAAHQGCGLPRLRAPPLMPLALAARRLADLPPNLR